MKSAEGSRDSAADMVTFQHPRRIQQVRTELNVTVNGRLDTIATALTRVSANPLTSSQKNWEGSNHKGEHFHSVWDLHLRMQAWSDEGDTRLTSIESSDKFDNSTFAVACADEEFGASEASLYQALHRKTANGPLRTVE